LLLDRFRGVGKALYYSLSARVRDASKPRRNADEHWHVDVSYLNIAGTFYFLCCRDKDILAARDRKLAEARERRKQQRQAQHERRLKPVRGCPWACHGSRT